MATKLIKLADGTLVEAEVEPGGAAQISGSVAEKVNASLDQVQPIVLKVCKALAATWETAAAQIHVESAEIELGLSFEGEGNLFITKATAAANLVVKLKLARPRAAAREGPGVE